MKNINNTKLLIDADCPLCKLYGNAFEKSGMLEKGTCTPYQTIDVSFTKMIDMVKAKNEIALLDTQTNAVVYGIDAIGYIIISNFPILKPIITWQPVDYLLRKFYKFISYNRKVIAPTKQNNADRACIPDINVTYRLFYMAFVVVFSSLILYYFTQSINIFFGVKSHLGREFLVCFGQIIWQSVILGKALKEKLLDYLGNMMTVSLIGTILLLPIFVLKYFLDLSPIFYIIYFGFVVGFMLFEHLRRCKILEVGYLPTISWVIYRVIVLILIASLN